MPSETVRRTQERQEPYFWEGVSHNWMSRPVHIRTSGIYIPGTTYVPSPFLRTIQLSRLFFRVFPSLCLIPRLPPFALPLLKILRWDNLIDWPIHTPYHTPYHLHSIPLPTYFICLQVSSGVNTCNRCEPFLFGSLHLYIEGWHMQVPTYLVEGHSNPASQSYLST